MKICLCGSTRFADEFTAWNKHLTLLGHVVYGLGYWPPEPRPNVYEKLTLDLVHLAKIEESDVVFAIVVKRKPGETLVEGAEPYVGESTAKEIQWASIRGKPIFYNFDVKTDAAFGRRETYEEGIKNANGGDS